MFNPRTRSTQLNKLCKVASHYPLDSAAALWNMENTWQQLAQWSPVQTATADLMRAEGYPREGVGLFALAFIQTSSTDRAKELAEEIAACGGWPAQTRRGLVFSVFRSATTCLNCCIKMRDAQIGLSIGDVLIAREQILGLPVIEANRLMDYAATGAPLCVERFVEVLGAPRNQYKIGTPQTLELKGFEEPITAYSIRAAQ